MKIDSVTIHGFKGIKHSEMRLDDYTLIIGPNNSGKSTAIQALLAFYEKDGFKFDINRDSPPAKFDDGESWVEVEYALTGEENSSLKAEYQSDDNSLRLRKYFRSKVDAKKIGFLHSVDTNGELHSDPFYGAKNVQSGKIGDLIFIPAVSKVDEHTKLTGPSAFRELVSEIVKDIVASAPAFQRLTEGFGSFASEMKKHETKDKNSLSSLETAINADLEKWGVKFQIDVQHPDADSLVKNLTSHSFSDSKIDRTGMAADSFGSGFQRQFIFTLIKLKAEHKPMKGKSNSKDFAPSMTCLLYEEPEAFLHPPQQNELTVSLQKLSTQDGYQVVCTTHSPHFVSRKASDIPSLVRAGRSGGGLVSLFQISKLQWGNIVDSNLHINIIAAKYPKLASVLQADDSQPEMESIKHSLWLNPDRCSMFFANMVLIVEGPTEVGLINALVTDDKIGRNYTGLYVLDAMGKYNIHRFMNLLSVMGIQHSVLYDDDNNREEHAEINQLINDSVCPGVTKTVSSIRGDLEILLGIPKSKSTHRKPQHVMYHFGQGNIEHDKLTSFCGIVNGCLSNPALAEGTSVTKGLEVTHEN